MSATRAGGVSIPYGDALAVFVVAVRPMRRARQGAAGGSRGG